MMPQENRYAPLKKVIEQARASLSLPGPVPEANRQNFCNGKMLGTHDHWVSIVSNAFGAAGSILGLRQGVSVPRAVTAGWLLFIAAMMSLASKASILMIEREKQDPAQQYIQQLRKEAAKFRKELSDVNQALEQPYADRTIFSLFIIFILTGLVWTWAIVNRVLPPEEASSNSTEQACQQASAAGISEERIWFTTAAILLSLTFSAIVEYKTKKYGAQRTAAVNQWLHKLISECNKAIARAEARPAVPLAVGMNVNALPDAPPQANLPLDEARTPRHGAGTGLIGLAVNPAVEDTAAIPPAEGANADVLPDAPPQANLPLSEAGTPRHGAGTGLIGLAVNPAVEDTAAISPAERANAEAVTDVQPQVALVLGEGPRKRGSAGAATSLAANP